VAIIIKITCTFDHPISILITTNYTFNEQQLQQNL